MEAMRHPATKSVRKDNSVLSGEELQHVEHIAEMVLLQELNFYQEDVMIKIKHLEMDAINVLQNPSGPVLYFQEFLLSAHLVVEMGFFKDKQENNVMMVIGEMVMDAHLLVKQFKAGTVPMFKGSFPNALLNVEMV